MKKRVVRRAKAPTVKERVIASRLTELQGGRSIRAFAAECDVDYRRLSTWLRGVNAPDAENLRRIATKQDISLDWLVGLPNAPMFRKQVRSAATLEADLSAHISRELHRRYPPPDSTSDPKKGMEPYMWVVVGERALEVTIEALRPAVEAALAEAHRAPETFRMMDRLGRAATALMEAKRRNIKGVDVAVVEEVLRLDREAFNKWSSFRRDDTVVLMPRRYLESDEP